MTHTIVPITAVLFDLDGTLLDSREVYWRAFVQAFRTVLKKELSSVELEQIMRMTTGDFLDLHATGQQRQALGLAVEEALAELFPQAKLFRGMETVLPALKQAGVRTAVVTSQSRPEMEISRRVIQIDAWIDVWVCADDICCPKPDPEPVHAALRLLQVPPAAAVMVGDTRFDLQSGQGAGTKTGLACWGATNVQELVAMNPDYVFHQPEDMTVFVQ